MKDLNTAKRGTPVVVAHGPHAGETGTISKLNINGNNSTILVKLADRKVVMAAGWVKRMKIR
jgi:ribosomal protein S4E